MNTPFFRKVLGSQKNRLIVEIVVVVLILVTFTVFSTKPLYQVTLDSGMVLLDATGEEDAWFHVNEVLSLSWEETKPWYTGRLLSGQQDENAIAGTCERNDGTVSEYQRTLCGRIV